MSKERSTLSRVQMHALANWLLDRKASIESGGFGDYGEIASRASLELKFPISLGNVRGACSDFKIKTPLSRTRGTGPQNSETLLVICDALTSLYNDLSQPIPTALSRLTSSLRNPPSTPT